MPTVTYTTAIKCVNQVRLISELPEGFVDNIPLFYRQARETEIDFYNNFVETSSDLFSNGSTSDDTIIEGGMTKRRELNGPCLLLDQVVGGFMSCPTYGLQINNLKSYIFRRANNLTAIYKSYPITISDSNFKSSLPDIIYTPNLKNSLQVFSTSILDAMSATGGIASYITAHSLSTQQFYDLCETTSVVLDSADPYPTIYNLRINYFPLYKNLALAIEKADGTYVQHVVTASAIDIFNGIISIDLTGFSGGVSNVAAFHVFYGVLPAYYPLVKDSHLEAYNSTTMQPVIISNKTSSKFDQISLSTNELTLVKDSDNTATDQVTIINNSNEYLFIESDQDIQINGKTFPGSSESLLPGQYSVLNIKLARSIYNTMVTTINIQIGLYDRYNGVKKYIDSIRITVS